MAVLDTNVLLDLGNPRRASHGPATALVREVVRRGDAVCTTRLNVAELRVGLERATDRAAEERRCLRALARVVVLELDESAGDEFGRVQARLLRLGRPVGDMDVLIAAVCLANGHGIITRNPRHFVDVPGLVVESY